jgi:recombination protein RecT
MARKADSTEPAAGQMQTASAGRSTVEQLFKANMTALVKAAPRTTGDPTRLIRVAYNAIHYDAKLRECTQRSLLAGVLESLKLGLTLGGPMQEAWLVAFNTKQSDGSYRPEATFIIGYQGFRNLIDRAKAVVDMQPQLVYQHDFFDAELSEPRVTHKPWWMVGADEPGEMVAVYVMTHLRGGGKQLTLLSRKDVDAHRARSRAKDSGPWVTDFGAMALKTVIRVAAKYVPKASEVMQLLSRALELEDRADRGEAQWEQFDPKQIDGQVFDQPAGEPAKGLEGLKAAMLGSGVPVVSPQSEPSGTVVGASVPASAAVPSPPESDEVVRGLFEG